MRTRIAALTALVVICVIGNADAQERVPLVRGGNIWNILIDEGCTKEQVAVLWPLVAQDSSLDPQNDRMLPVGTPITLKRDCNGHIVTGTSSDAAESISQIVDLREQVRIVTIQRDEAISENKRLIDELEKLPASAIESDQVASLKAELDVAKMNLSERPLRTPRQAYIEAAFFGGSIALGVGFIGLVGFVIRWRKDRRERRKFPIGLIQREPKEEARGLQLPDVISVNHNGNSKEFHLHIDTEKGRYHYQCPDDASHKFTSASPEKFLLHLRLHHAGETEKETSFQEAKIAS